MRNWRILTAIAAVVLAALAGVLVWRYADDAREDAKKPFTFVTVLVAKSRVPTGTSFDSALRGGLVEREQRVLQSVPETRIDGSLTNDQLRRQFANLVAAHDIPATQTLVSEDFVGQVELQSGLSGQLESDQAKDRNRQLMAVTLTLDDASAVGGFLTPGDTVNVMVSLALDADKWVTGQGPPQHVNFTSFLLPGVKVLAVGSTTARPRTATGDTSGTTPTTQAPVSRNLITFEVTARQAQQLVHAQAAGTLYLSLNPPSFKPGTFRDPGEIVEAVNLFDKPLPTLDAEAPRLATKR